MFLVHSTHKEAPLLAQAVVTACKGPDGWVTPLQPRLLHVLFERLVGLDVDFEQLQGTTIDAAASGLGSQEQRIELIELMVMAEILAAPIPVWLEQNIEDWAASLGVESSSLELARDLATHASHSALQDFYRCNWIGELDRQNPHFEELFSRYGDQAFTFTMEEEPETIAKWSKLEFCPAGSIGRHVWDFYQARDFKLPGSIGSANEALARHDWIHVLGDFDTTPMGEMEVTAFQAAASSLPGATLGFIGAVSIFETGMLQSLVAPGHIHNLDQPDGPERIADAISRGKALLCDVFQDIDFFARANQPLTEMRIELGVRDKVTSN